MATISINVVFGDNGIIKRAEASKGLQEIEEEKQRLELIKPEVLADNLGKMTVEQYVEALKENGITVDEDITTNPDGSKTVITDTGYSVLIEQDGEKNVKITIEGKAGNLPPRIVNVTLTRGEDKTSIIVNVEVVRTEGAIYKYYYKTETGEYQSEAINIENKSNVTITGLNENELYTIKVEVMNDYGMKEKEVSEEDPRPLVTTITSTEHENIVARDRLGNQVTMPGGFKISKGTGETVEDGIVIEDNIGNQFVWIPVSNIDGDGAVNNQEANGLINRKDGSKVQITLGRYRMDIGIQELIQKGSEYNLENTNNKFTISSYHQELTVFHEANQTNSMDSDNATAFNLGKFIESVEKNKGYYIGRYEASYGSGNNVDNYIPLVQKSTNNSISNMKYEEGTLWNYITQGDASKVCRNMYQEHEYIESDLMNSYMWDTAIVYIQAMGHTNFSNANRDTTGNTELLNTGETGDEKCHIFDITGNLTEWTTEHSIRANSTSKSPATVVGGGYLSPDFWVCRRNTDGASYNYVRGYTGFRPGIYIKEDK